MSILLLEWQSNHGGISPYLKNPDLYGLLFLNPIAYWIPYQM
ncbi:hypothetical protein [Pseudanabaena sp. BC1403]|nr:hypothetical protein [Pseudanabaena sp. BC1403]